MCPPRCFDVTDERGVRSLVGTAITRCPAGSSRAPANRESGGAGPELRGLAPAPRATKDREWKRGQGGCRDPLCAQRQNSDFGLGRGEDLLAVLDLVVHRLGGGEERLVRTPGQQ